MKEAKEVLYGLYDDETELLAAVRQANADHLEIEEVYSPFPVHGLDPLLGLSESRLHIAGFVYGAIGTLTAFLFMTWVFTRDWPIIFGGKPYFSAPPSQKLPSDPSQKNKLRKNSFYTNYL